ncbi:rab-GTPase-TBC domain-containing protein [Cerioporus squamosus]|nr:rab-GTPase-TBC domain-containing protein [Cerioporus squamosus]
MEDGAPQRLEDLDWQALRTMSLRPHGFGEERVRIWPQLVHIDPKQVRETHETPDDVWSDTTFEQALEDPVLEEKPHVDERQIELDTDRSFVLYPVEGVSHREKLQAALNRLIVSVFRRRPRLHYFQGYHDIVSVIFLTLPKELHLPVTEKLSLHRVRDSMGANLDPVVGLLRILKRLLHLADEKFAATLDSTAPLPYFALSNLLTLFSHDVPTLPLIQHIFDYLLSRPPIVVVYLAAALTLARREEVRVLEEEGEEGMMHSLLTALPNLYEEGEEIAVEAKTEESENTADRPFKTEDAPSTIPEGGAPVTAATADPPTGPEAPDIQGPAQGVKEDPEEGSQADDASAVPDPEPATTTDTLASDDVPPPIGENGAHEVDARSVDPTSSPDATVEVKVERSEPPLPEAEDEKRVSRTASPEPLEHEPRPQRARISVTALLRHADELFTLYPPTHPGIALTSIMGPQSVMLTWSERASEVPDDDEAELMVTRPELIVLPYVEHEEEDEGGKEKRRRDKEKEERRRRKLRKPRRLTDMVVQRKTMVAGAVLVLGVAMAVYGLNGGMPGGNGHHRHGFGKEWRKVGRLLGGVIMGAGGRVYEGIRRGLE